MSATLLLVQALNGLQLGILLFLLAAGLTLVFGIMNFINLAHGSLYMMGAFIAATVFRHSGSFLLAAAAVVAGMALLGLVLDRVAGAALSARAPGPGAGHLRLHPVLQRADAHHLGSGAHQHGAAVLAVRHHRPARRDLSAVPLPHHRGGTGGGGRLLRADPPHAARHADPRRLHRPHDGGRAGREYRAAEHAAVRAGRGAGRRGGADGGPDPVGADRHGRADPDPDAGGDRHRRHRLGARRLPGGADGEPGRHAGPRAAAGPAARCRRRRPTRPARRSPRC